MLRTSELSQMAAWRRPHCRNCMETIYRRLSHTRAVCMSHRQQLRHEAYAAVPRVILGWSCGAGIEFAL
jgi:hypothetical protein